MELKIQLCSGIPGYKYDWVICNILIAGNLKK